MVYAVFALVTQLDISVLLKNNLTPPSIGPFWGAMVVANTKFVPNSATLRHSEELALMLEGARRLVIAVAFARLSGWTTLKANLVNALKKGATAQIVVGTDFCQTEPAILRALAAISAKYKAAVYVVDGSNATFHPKLYYSEKRALAVALVGSANWTNGGFQTNAELSLHLEGEPAELGIQIDEILECWKVRWSFVPIGDFDIDGYEADHKKAKDHEARRPLRRPGKLPASGSEASLDVSRHRAFLAKIGGRRRRQEVKGRLEGRTKAGGILADMAQKKYRSETTFLAAYEKLVRDPHYWHSGGLQRLRRVVARSHREFSRMVSRLVQLKGSSDHKIFESALTLTHQVNGAGPNVMTEILHTIDNKRFAVMNRNSVAGLRLAGIKKYPARPAKVGMSADLLVSFREDMDRLRRALGFETFTELDWLLNRMFWKDAS